MEVIHRRCAGLDVHKETVVACVRLVLDGKISRIPVPLEAREYAIAPRDCQRSRETSRHRGARSREATGFHHSSSVFQLSNRFSKIDRILRCVSRRT
jgi:hypothetical protein